MVDIFLYCRPGFERENVQHLKKIFPSFPAFKAKDGSGVVHSLSSEFQDFSFLQQTSFAWRSFPYARQVMGLLGLFNNLPEGDRIEPLLVALQSLPMRFSDCFVETPDTDANKELLTFCRAFSKPFRQALQSSHLWDASSPWRVHVCFISYAAAYLGISYIPLASPWFMGIPRLKFPKEAPSRSTLKLEEAFLTLLTDRERVQWLRPHQLVVDLGAAPGGWTWQFVRRECYVQSIDNGALSSRVCASGLVEHIQEDGFVFVPRRKVHWVVCDIIDNPFRVARLMLKWYQEQWAERAIFNLKLPMKDKFETVERCINLLQNAGVKDIRYKQLYHDRDEVTVFAHFAEQ